jgi:hypothetical protein
VRRGEAGRGVLALIAELLDDKPSRDGYLLSLEGERMLELDTARCGSDGRLSLQRHRYRRRAGGRNGGARPSPPHRAVRPASPWSFPTACF